jgi:putative FmdB family regulatory protein
MPLYEFHCNACDKEFTLVVSVHDYEKKDFSCPSCSSKDVERVIEAVGVITSKKS